MIMSESRVKCICSVLIMKKINKKAFQYRMCTAYFCGGGGAMIPGGYGGRGYSPRGHSLGVMVWGGVCVGRHYPLVDRMTHTCENITFP